MAKDSPHADPSLPDWTWQAKVRRLVGRVGSAWRWANRDWLHRGIAALLLVILFGGLGLWRWSAGSSAGSRTAPTQRDALAALEAGRYEEARAIANQLREDPRLDYEQHSGPLYVLGAVLAHDAAEQWNEERRKTLYLLAARYLQEARERKLDPALEADAVFLLGQCLYLAESYAEAIPVLQDALALNPHRETRIHLLLANCYYHAATPNLDLALKHARQFVAVEDTERRQRELTWLQIANLEVRKRNFAAARDALEQISDDSEIAPLKTLHEIRLEIIATDQDVLADPDGDNTEVLNRYYRSIEKLQQLMARHPPGSEVVRGASYLIGVCYRQRGHRLAATGLERQAQLEYEKALQQFFRTQKLFYRFAEGIVAALEEPELYQQLGRYEEAAQAYDRLINDLRGFEPYDNPWLSEQELIDRLKAAHARFLAGDEFAAAVRFAEQLESVLPPVESTLLLATSLESWAQHLESQSISEPWSNAEGTLSQAREKWRQAAIAYRRLAQLRFATRNYPEDLWSTANAFLKGRNYRQAVKAIQKYLENEPRPLRARGLIALGEAYLALGDPDTAFKHLNDVINFYSTHPLSYRARILAARAALLKGDWQAAQKLLEANIEHEDLSPRSLEWRDSLFALAELLYQRGIHEDATSRLNGLRPARDDHQAARLKHLEQANRYYAAASVRLREAIERYPDTPQAIIARYQYAEAQRKGARYLFARLAKETIEADRNNWRRQIRKQLELAVELYRQLQKELNVKQESQTLSATEALILRNSYFADADCLFDLQSYNEAIKAYSSVSNRYQNEPIALEAFVQIAACYHRMGRLSDARGTIEQARVVLSRIPQDANFLATTRYNRKDWEKLLNWMAAL